MAQPIIKKQDLLQSRPEPIYINTNPMMRLNVYENDGFDQPVKNPTFVLANSTVVLKDLDADDSVEIGTVTTAETPVSNGVQISFPLKSLMFLKKLTYVKPITKTHLITQFLNC